MQSPSLTREFAGVALLVIVCIFPAAARQSNPERDSFAKYTDFPGARAVGSETCATCHSEVAANFKHAYHAQQGVGCEQCHGLGSLHVEGGGDKSKIVLFRQRSQKEANGVCLSCHLRDENVRHWTSGVHAANQVRCIDCHQVHASGGRAAQEGAATFGTETGGALRAALVSPETGAMVQSRSVINLSCLKCHQTQRAQLSMPYHHPLREGKMSCVDCHDAHGGAAGRNLRMANANQLCLGCHAQYRGPFAYQHPPVSENCLSCHSPHGSPNTNLLSVSEPALCLQCHTGHHNGAGLPLAERCTNCHSSIHGADVATPSGGSRFIDKGAYGIPTKPAMRVAAGALPLSGQTAVTSPHSSPQAAKYAVAAVNGPAAMLSAHLRPSHTPAAMLGGDPAADTDPSAAGSITLGSYRFLHISGFPGRVGEYDSLQQSAGADLTAAYVLPRKHLTLVLGGNALTSNDYSVRSQLTVGDRLKAGLDLRSLVQQQDHYRNYLAQLSSDFATPGAVTDTIPANARFSVTRRLGNGYARVKAPRLPVHLFVKGDWQARVGSTQLTYLDENSTPAVYVGGVNTTCGQLCHAASQYQRVNQTTRNVSGGVDVELQKVLRMGWEHTYSRFNDRLTFPIGTYTGPFTPENEGYSPINPPPSGPAPQDLPAGNYYVDIPSPNQFSADTLRLTFTPSAQLIFNGNASYTRLRNTYLRHDQNWFDTDETLSWTPQDRLRMTADYHRQNMINAFAPYYTLYGNVSYHRHWEGVSAQIEFPGGFSVETRYKHSGITRSNARLWPQIYSIDNTDLLTVVSSTDSNTAGVAARLGYGGLWNARAGFEWTGTEHPGYLIVPRTNKRAFASLWVTPKPWLTFSNDATLVAQDDFAPVRLPNTPGHFQRRDRFYTEAASAVLHPVPAWTLGLGYSYQQKNLRTYTAFQNDNSVGYVMDDPALEYKQLSQVVWGDSTYTVKDRLGLDLRFTHDASNSGYRPDLNPNDAALLGNASLIQQGTFDAGMFKSALANLALSSTQISEVKVPQWIGQGKAHYLFPHKIEGGLVFYYGSYRDHWNPNLNGVLRSFDLYVGRTW